MNEEIKIVKTMSEKLILYKIESINNDGDVVGHINYIKHGNPYDGLIEIYEFEVDVEFRGKGVAKEMFNYLIKSEELRKLFLLTHKDNIRAQKFYEKMGMIKETELKQHWHKDEDEFIYSRFF